jgi:hypothetical protein
MLTRTQDDEEIIERVAALDVGKAELMCCLRVPDEDHPGKRLQEVAAYPTMTRSLQRMCDHLTCLGVTRVVMEATSDYWKPVFYLLEAAGLDAWLVNAKITVLEEAFTGQFTSHHAFLLGAMLNRVDAISADIAGCAVPFADLVAQLDEIPGISLAAAYVILAEIGTDMTRFPPPGTWCPGPGWRPASGNRRARRKARAQPGMATPTWPPSWATPPPEPPRPTPSSANGTGG